MAEGVAGYYDFIATKRYENLKTAKNYIEYANFLKMDGYATSSSYVNTICSKVTSFNLQSYDLGNVPVPASYTIGKTYTTDANLYIRTDAAGERVMFDEITDNAKKSAYTDASGFAILKKGTRVTCKETKTLGVNIWMRIPSGWICAKQGAKTYIV